MLNQLMLRAKQLKWLSIKSRLIGFIPRQLEANVLPIARTPFPDDRPFSLLELLSDSLPRNVQYAPFSQALVLKHSRHVPDIRRRIPCSLGTGAGS